MWHYITKKEKSLSYEVGIRGKKTLKRLTAKIKHISCRQIWYDTWKSYRSVILKDKPIQSKKETTQIETKNFQIRHDLARFHRKTYSSKFKLMLEYDIIFFIHRKSIISLFC